jgi:hypothetical protein
METIFRSIGQIALAAVIGAGSWGCAMVMVQAPSRDDVEVTTRFGIVSVEIRPGAGAVLVESTTVGAVNSFEGFALGYHNANIAAVAGGRCQMVLWIRTNEQLQELNALLREGTDVCVVRTEASRGGKP